MTSLRALAPAVALALTLSAAPALASTATNATDPAGTLTLTPTAPGEANTLTIAFADASGTTPSGYTVHDASTPITLAGDCTGCTQSDPNTVFVPAGLGVIVTTGDADSSVVVSGQEPLSTSLTNSITGGAGNDTLSGGHLPDTMAGGGGNDTLNGGANNDTLNGGAGDDTLNGGARNDTFSSADGDGADAISGGTGVDSVNYATKSTGAIGASEDGAANDGVSGEGDNVGGIEGAVGTAFADSFSLSGTTSGGTIQGGAGDDVITGSAAPETILGGAGSDAIQAGGGSDAVFGDAGNDTLGAGAGDDDIFGGAGDDVVDAGPGNDSLTGIVNGDGADAYTGGSGDDDISYAQVSGPVSITQNGAADDGQAGEGDNVAADIEDLTGSPDADTILAGPANNTIFGNGGEDTLDGGAGNDIVQSSGNGVGSTLRGGDGSDTLSGNTGDDLLDGGAGDDLLLGNNGGADTFTGGPGTDGVSFITSFFAGGVTITPDGVANDGRSEQGANVGTDVENFTGSFGPDTITGASGVANRIDGNGGGDTINVASAPADRDTVFCRSTVGIGFARRGFGIAGGYNDVVNADAKDRVSDHGATACATINRPAKIKPRAKILTSVARSTGRVFTVSFQCLSAVPSCRINAQVATPRGTALDHGRVVIKSGKTGQILFHVSRQRRKMLARGGKFKERVSAVVGDSSGRTTEVAKTITLKAARTT